MPENSVLYAPLRQRGERPGHATAVAVRRARPDDQPAVAEMLARLSEQTRYQRYFHPAAGSAAWARIEAGRLVRPAAEGVTLVATVQFVGAPEVGGVAELTAEAGTTGFGEVAVLVRDDLQGHGVGLILARQLIAIARARGVAELHADMLPSNGTALRLLRRLGVPYSVSFALGLIHIAIPLAAASPEDAG
jgi:acetyltransferase